MIAEFDGAGAVLRRYVHGPGEDEPLVWYEGSGLSGRRWLYGDERGSVIAVADGAGTALGLNAYDEFGIRRTGNLGRYGYTGQSWLPDTGLSYYKARMYNPALGRFMQTDPIGYAGGMNWYAYVTGDPVNATDPSGLCKQGEISVVITGSRIPRCVTDGGDGGGASIGIPGISISGTISGSGRPVTTPGSSSSDGSTITVTATVTRYVSGLGSAGYLSMISGGGVGYGGRAGNGQPEGGDGDIVVTARPC